MRFQKLGFRITRLASVTAFRPRIEAEEARERMSIPPRITAAAEANVSTRGGTPPPAIVRLNFTVGTIVKQECA